MGYLNRNEGYGCINKDFVDQFPQISGVASHNVPPTIGLDQFNTLGCNAGVNLGNVTTRPTFIANDAVTWTKSAHTIKVGMEWRKIMGNIHANGNEAGSFNFGGGATGIVGVNSGSSVASFLLGAADNANVDYRSVPSWYARQSAWILHAGDSWRANSKLTLDYGLRWDYYSPSSEKNDQMSFFDPTGANPGAGGRPGRLAFSGDAYGAASYGATYPEKNWYGGLAPRVGAVYALNDKTVIRGGWGIFYTQAFYPGWGGGMSLDGFSNQPTVNATGGGIVPAMYLDQGFPIQNFALPPDIRSDYKNGQSIYYRNLDGNERPYTHQWNITVDRELGHHFALSAAYVGSAGRRMPSSLDPLNAIDPKYLSLGPQLNDEFQPGDTSLDGVALPYAGWVEQLNAGSCAPSVAQALRPFPQYCDSLQGQNEAHGKTMYNSMQLKLERRYSNGIYALVSYTLSHLMENGSPNTQRDAATWSGLSGVISPFEKEPELHDLPKRHATRPVGGIRLRTAVRPRQEVRECVKRCGWRDPRRLAGQHDLQVPVGATDVLPVRLLQRARRVPHGLHPGDHRCGRGVRAGQGQLRSSQGATVQQGRLRAGQTRSTTTRAVAIGSKAASAALPTRTRTSR